MCGIAGLKPTYGRISQYGTVPGTGAYSCNHTGILAKTVADTAIILSAVAGHDPKDPLSARQPVAKYTESLGKNVKGLKVGILRGYFEEVMATEVKQAFYDALAVLEKLGLETEEVTIPHMDLIPAVKVCTSRVENASAHDHNLRTRARDYSPQTLYAYLAALLVPASTYVMAQRVRRIICDEFRALLERVQLFAIPTVGFAAPTIEECNSGWLNIDGKKIRRQDARSGADSFCAIPFNVTGLPSLNVCCGFSSGGYAHRNADCGRPVSRGPHLRRGPCLRAGNRLAQAPTGARGELIGRGLFLRRSHLSNFTESGNQPRLHCVKIGNDLGDGRTINGVHY